MPLQIKLSITKKNDGQVDPEAESTLQSSNDPTMSKGLSNLDVQDADEDTKIYSMGVDSSGKYTRKATWEDLIQYTGQDMSPEVLREWIVNYQARCFPDDLEKPFHVPQKCFIRDENGGTIYKDFGWKPVKINLTPGSVDVKESWTKEVCLESFPLDYSTSLEQILLHQGDKKITSTLRKSKLAGHALSIEMMKTNSEIITEFQGIESVAFGVLGNSEPSEVDESTGDEIWKDVKSLRALLHGATLPKKEGAGVTREAKVLANESYLKARVYYKCYFSNDVATDHEGKFDGKPYWKFPMKYLLQYNGMPKNVVIYEDVELRFYTDIRVAMDNKDWEWVKDQNGRWKKQFATVTTSVSRRKSDGDKQLRETSEHVVLDHNDEEEDEKRQEQDRVEYTPNAVPKDTETQRNDEPNEKENSPMVVDSSELTNDKTAEQDYASAADKPDPDGIVLDDSVGRMSIGEHSLEP